MGGEEISRIRETVIEHTRALARELLNMNVHESKIVIPNTPEEFSRIVNEKNRPRDTLAFYDKEDNRIYVNPEYLERIARAEKMQRENPWEDPEEYTATLASVILHELTHMKDDQEIKPEYRDPQRWKEKYDERAIAGEAKAHMIEMIAAKKMHKYAAEGKLWELEDVQTPVTYDPYNLGRHVGYLVGFVANPGDGEHKKLIHRVLSAKSMHEFVQHVAPLLELAEKDPRISKELRERAKRAKEYLLMAYPLKE